MCFDIAWLGVQAGPMKRRTLLVAMALLAPAAWAGAPEVNLKDGAALGGYDAVSYFGGSPVQGSGDFKTSWKDAEWRFASQANLDAFKASPEKYAPQYGGYCAYAVSKGATAPGDPTVYSVVEGKLYLNLSSSVQKLWAKDIPGHIKAADGNWPGVLK
jgi:YHS domain-containing protein